jgi:hypothetical protein
MRPLRNLSDAGQPSYEVVEFGGDEFVKALRVLAGQSAAALVEPTP